MLGAPIGSAAFVEAVIKRKVEKVREVERQQRMAQTEIHSWVNCRSSEVKKGE